MFFRSLTFSAVLSALLSTQSFALGWTNCASADGEFSIIEKEIWGANPVSCRYNGQSINHVTIQQATKSVIATRSTGDDKEIWYSANALVEVPTGPMTPAFSTESVYVICHQVTSSARDLVAPQLPCTVIHE